MAPESARCNACLIDLTSPAALRLGELSSTIEELRLEGAELADSLRREAARHGEMTRPPLFAPPMRPAKRADRESEPTNVRNLLLWLGASLCCIAALLFLAFTWDRLGVNARATVMIGATALAAIAAHVTYRRRLHATGEALMTTAAAFYFMDVAAAHRLGFLGVDSIEGWLYWSMAFVLIATGSAAYRSRVAMTSPGIVAVVGGQVPLFIVLGALEIESVTLRAAALSVQVLVLAQLTTGFKKSSSTNLSAIASFSAYLTASALGLWIVGTSLAVAVDERTTMLVDTLSGLGVVGLMVFFAPRVAHLNATAVGRGDRIVIGLASVGALTLASAFLSGSPQWLALCVIGVALLIVAKPESNRRQMLAPFGIAFASLGLLGHAGDIIGALMTPLSWLTMPWTDVGYGLASSPLGQWTGSSLTLVSLTVVALGFIATARLRAQRRSFLGAGAYAAIVLLLATPVVLDFEVHVALGAYILGALLLGMTAPRITNSSLRHAARFGAWFSLVEGVALSIGSEPASLTVLVLATLVTAAIASRDTQTRSAAIIATEFLGLASIGTITQSVLGSWQGTAFAMFLSGLLIALIADELTSRMRVLQHLGTTSLVVAVSTLLTLIGEPDWLSIALLATGIVATVAALRARRRHLGWVAAVALLLFTWLRLGMAEISVPEAYTLPLAALLLAVGLRVKRLESDASSWKILGWPLALLAVTSGFALLDNDSLLRASLYGAGALSLLLLGARTGSKAPLAIGGSALLFDAAIQLLPYAAQVPRWVVVGAVGILLVTLGATYERRLQEISFLRSRFDSMN